MDNTQGRLTRGRAETQEIHEVSSMTVRMPAEESRRTERLKKEEYQRKTSLHSVLQEHQMSFCQTHIHNMHFLPPPAPGATLMHPLPPHPFYNVYQPRFIPPKSFIILNLLVIWSSPMSLSHIHYFRIPSSMYTI